MIWAAMSLCWCWSTVFSEVHSQRSHLPETLEHFHAYEDADFIFQQTWHLPTLPKVPKAGSMTMVFTVLDWPANSPDLNPIENLWGISRGR